ncbi:MAG: SLC13 family permease [bacterium]
MPKSTQHLIICGALAVLVFALILSQTPPAGLTTHGVRVLGLLGFTIILWASEVISSAATSFLVFILIPLLGILPLDQAISTLGSETVWQLIGIYIISSTIVKFRLDRRLAYNLLRLSRGDPSLVSLVFILTTVLFTFLVPAPVGKVALLLPIAAQCFNVLELSPTSNTRRATYFGLGSVSLISGVAILTGCPATLYAAQLIGSEVGQNWTYGYWFLLFFPPIFLISLLTWPLLLIMYPPEKRGPAEKATFMAFLQERIDELGPLSNDEKRLILVLGVMIGLWATGGYLHSLPVTLVCLIAATALFLPGIELTSWEEASSDIGWPIILVFTAGLSLTRGLTQTGAATWLGNQIGIILGGLDSVWAGAAAFVLLNLLRLTFTTPTAYVAAFLPVAFAAAGSLALNPAWLGGLTAIAAHTAVLYPMQSMTLLTAYTESPLTPREVFVTGSAFTLLTIVVTLLTAFFYWPHFGLLLK